MKMLTFIIVICIISCLNLFCRDSISFSLLYCYDLDLSKNLQNVKFLAGKDFDIATQLNSILEIENILLKSAYYRINTTSSYNFKIGYMPKINSNIFLTSQYRYI